MKSRLNLVPYFLLVTFVVAGTVWHFGDIREHDVSTGEAVTIGGPFSLTDQNGVVRTEKDYRDKYMLMFFGYTYCPDVCPTTLAVMSAALDKLGPRAERIVPVLISVDPKRDTPEKLKSYLASFGSRFVGLTGTSKDIAAVAKEYRVYYNEHPTGSDGDYTVDHSGIVYLMDPKGAFLANYSLATTPEAMAADLTKKTLP
jgi:protein SCO1/2